MPSKQRALSTAHLKRVRQVLPRMVSSNMSLKLFHYSDNGSIEKFVPRPVQTPSQRSKGFDWLNAPLVWAIDEWHQPMYLFPRDCPRILVWRTKNTATNDALLYFRNTDARMLAYVEQAWVSKLASETLYRYELPTQSFRTLNDAGMWVSRQEVVPIDKTQVINLPCRLNESNVELRVLDNLTQMRDAWDTTLHVSGIRLRNAKGWDKQRS